MSASRSHRQVCFGVPPFSCLWGFHVRTCLVIFVLGFLKVWPNHPHLLLRISIWAWCVLSLVSVTQYFLACDEYLTSFTCYIPVICFSHMIKLLVKCYEVLYTYLAGNSRKNELYIAKHLDFFKSQISYQV